MAVLIQEDSGGDLVPCIETWPLFGPWRRFCGGGKEMRGKKMRGKGSCGRGKEAIARGRRS
jgi:hypothetical protein